MTERDRSGPDQVPNPFKGGRYDPRTGVIVVNIAPQNIAAFKLSVDKWIASLPQLPSPLSDPRNNILE